MSTQELSAIGYDNKSPKFNGNNYAWWKNRIQNVIMGIDYECWLVVKNGPNIILKTDVEGNQVPKKDSELVIADYKLLEKNAKAMSILQQAIAKKISANKNSKGVKYVWRRKDQQDVNPESQPSVAMWWNSIGKYYGHANPKKPTSLSLSMGKQVIDDTYSLGKTLTSKQVEALAAKGPQQPNAITVVLTAADVVVEGFCTSRCGTHRVSEKATQKVPYIWVGNSETQCPGQCAWPFHQPIYGPQSPPLTAPNNDVGLDGMVINLASLLAGTVTNPYGNGYFQGPKDAPLEAASACPGIYGKGAYPGYAGNLLVDATTGASYNANGINKRKYLLPALYDPKTSSCSTLL
uniref:Uncharacterized protein n=1 Tax=Chenopodium quinoa TaxID=63459 RepID=A0A803LUQ2_CHEQI